MGWLSMWGKPKMGSIEALLMGGFEKQWQGKTTSMGRSLVVHHVIYFVWKDKMWKDKRPKVRIYTYIWNHGQ